LFWGDFILGAVKSSIEKFLVLIICGILSTWDRTSKGCKKQGVIDPRKNVQGNTVQGRFIMASFIGKNRFCQHHPVYLYLFMDLKNIVVNISDLEPK
jgi:hypothetical protein